jgi:hypothetical protein
MNSAISVRGPGRRAPLIGRAVGAGAGIAMAVSCLVPAGALGSVQDGAWGRAQPVRGLAAFASSGITSVSCASPGNCSAGGFLIGSSSGEQAFVVNQENGTWGKAEEVPGMVALDTGRQGLVDSVSCASPGNCSAAGEYATPGSREFPVHAFVVSEKNGIWGKAEKVPGIAALSKGGQAQISSVSCASPGNCSAGGSSSSDHAFVVSQKNGTWGRAEKVPGLAAFTTRGSFADIRSVSCAAAGNCSAAGAYLSNGFHGFVVSQEHGRWGKALPFPRTSEIDSLSCASPGNCSAGGGLFAVSEKKGIWGKAEQFPGLAALSKRGSPVISSLSCSSAGNCSAGGNYTDGSGHEQGFVVSQRHGRWGRATEVPGLGALNTAGEAEVDAVSCGAAGNCVAVGFYHGRHRVQGFVVSQHDGTWGQAQKVPGLTALNKDGIARVTSVSCASAGSCSAGGSYDGRSRLDQAFVVSKAR